MKWTDELSVGIEVIDNQHKILFDLANDINRAVSIGATKRTIDSLFSVIINFSYGHFATEESFIQGENDFQAHCYNHYQLLRQLHEYAVEYRNNRPVEVPPGIFLEKWLKNHIKDCDIPSLAARQDEIVFPVGVDLFDEFDSAEIDMRKHKRVRFDRVLDEDIFGHCYNASKLKTSTVSIIELASGGLRIYSHEKMDIDDLLIISCRVGKNFKMREKATVKNAKDGFYGVEFVAPAEETVQFLTELCGATHLY